MGYKEQRRYVVLASLKQDAKFPVRRKQGTGVLYHFLQLSEYTAPWWYKKFPVHGLLTKNNVHTL